MKDRSVGLVIQNNPFSYNTNNGKTIASILSEWDSECLAQIYTSDLEPDFSICKHFFKMGDAEALRSLFLKRPFGMNIAEANFENKSELNNEGKEGKSNLKKYIINILGGSSLVAVVRDFIWRKSNWNNDHLQKWLEEINPTYVYLIAGNNSAFYDIAMFICKKFNIPLFIHIGDDYFIYRRGINPFKNIQRHRMSKKLGEAIDFSAGIIAICDKLAEVFKKKYGGRYTVCMNNVDIKHGSMEYRKKDPKDILKLVYAGNLGLNRWKILNLIGHALSELDNDGIKAELNVYSPYIPEQKIQKKLTNPPELNYCGSVYGKELKKILRDADILVHVEAFEKRYRQLTYTAMSTKISEYLGEGKIILAVGPSESASIEFLQKERGALVVTEPKIKSIKKQICQYIDEPEEMLLMEQRAKEIAENKFSREKNARRIYDFILAACKE